MADHVSKYLEKSPGPIESNERRESSWKNKASPEECAAVWTKLEIKGYVHDDLDTITAEEWMREFSKLTYEQLQQGLDRVNDVKEFFNQGTFLRLCKDSVYAPYHKPFAELSGPEPTTPENAKERIKKLREDTGL